ncbi:EpsG family protein [Plebeiibacterium marinum]|uniref:EpsG family protein n=1 Tax=Plebeiibacterium marinum TaxID=2992111 RepID=A0AAE3MAI9_9BACT|nr:EpsG family protein [Plebeiobacterium marinum]MCW3804148.1 EpsG family protein [Plebeiobacterium marinum]
MNSRFEIWNYYTRNNRSVYFYILFFIWPFVGFLSAVFNFRDQNARRVIYLFLIYYGFLFVNDTVGIDSYSYSLKLVENSYLSFSEFWSSVDTDIVEPLISFLISRITTEDSLYFAFWAAFMGYFYIKSIEMLSEKFDPSFNINRIIFVVLFIFISPITDISGIRMPTATWVFFYGAMRVLINGDKKFLLLTLCASLIHWSFITVNLLLFVYVLMGNKNIIYIPIAVLSFVLPGLLSPLFSLLSVKFGGSVQERYSGYSNESYMEAVIAAKENASWFMKVMNEYMFYFLILGIIFVFVISLKMQKTKGESNLFSFLLLLVSFVNFGSAIPTFGGRYRYVFYLFASFFILLFFNKTEGRKIHPINMVGLLPILVFVMVQFRIGTGSINAWMLCPVFGLPLFIGDLSLSSVLFN